jgi:AraC-like DNA-binding protein
MENGEWSQPTDQQYIRFIDVEPGKHKLTLQCVSRTSGTVIDSLTLTISISQPWWNTWWMWCVYVALLLIVFYGAWRVYQLHEKYMRLTIDHLQMVESEPRTMQHSEPVVVQSQTESQDSSESVETSEAVNDFVEKATGLIVEHLSDSEFNIDRLCREMAMSRTLFYVKLKSYTGKSPQDFIRIIRLERAASMLRGGRNVTDVAALTGFDNPKYFSTVFKKYFGVSPSKYH